MVNHHHYSFASIACRASTVCFHIKSSVISRSTERVLGECWEVFLGYFMILHSSHLSFQFISQYYQQMQYIYIIYIYIWVACCWQPIGQRCNISGKCHPNSAAPESPKNVWYKMKETPCEKKRFDTHNCLLQKKLLVYLPTF